MNKILPPKGMRDFLPDECRKRTYLMDKIRQVYEKYGYEPIETPSMENLSVLQGKGGEENEKLMFKILKRGEKLSESVNQADFQGEALSDLGLRFEFTISLARFMATHQGKLPRLFKRYQMGPVWRADRPQDGRFREFIQCDLDSIGEASPLIEAEQMLAVVEVMNVFGIRDFFIRMSDRRLLPALMKDIGLDEEELPAAMIAIDKLDKIGVEGVKELLNETLKDRSKSMKLSDYILQITAAGTSIKTSITALKNLRENIQNLENQKSFDDAMTNLTQIEDLTNFSDGLRLVVDPSLVRGLSYYTGTIFELAIEGYPFSFGGGGRYDNLVGMFSGQTLPACGFSLGFERLYKVMQDKSLFPTETERSPIKALLVPSEDVLMKPCLLLAQELRAAGFHIDVFPVSDKYKKAFIHASAKGIPAVILLDSQLVMSNQAKIRFVLTNQELIVPIEKIRESL